MALQSVENTQTRTNPYLRIYPKFLPEGVTKQGVRDTYAAHPSTLPGTKLASGGFAANKKTAKLPDASEALVRQGEVLKKQIGAGRHALQYVAAGSAALGLAVACGGHPWAGFAVAAIGLLVGFGVQAYVRHRALKQVGPNGLSGEDFKSSFEAMLQENGGVVNDPAMETAAKVYGFLTRSFWEDTKHDLLQPAKRAAVGSLRLAGAGLSKLFSARSKAASAPATQDDKTVDDQTTEYKSAYEGSQPRKSETESVA